MILDAFSLKGKNALVTGSRRGLGAAIAIGLAEAGANVVVHGSQNAGLAEVAAAVRAAGVKAVNDWIADKTKGRILNLLQQLDAATSVVLVNAVLQMDAFAGHLFVFFNRPRDRVKILHWDRSGFWLYYKRLEDGSFRLPTTQRNVIEIEAAELALILEGIDLAGSQRQPRFSLRKV